MPDCPKCRVTFYDGESHNCRGIGRVTPRRGAVAHMVIAALAGGALGALIGMPLHYFVPSDNVLLGTTGLGMLLTFLWLRARARAQAGWH